MQLLLGGELLSMTKNRCFIKCWNSKIFTSVPEQKFLTREKTPHILLEKIKQSLSESEHSRLEQFTSKSKFYTSTVPIKSVGVQGDCRSYSRVACISGPPDWENLAFLAKLIPRICHSINRVCYVIGEPIKETHFPDDTTPTTLSTHALEQLRECDYIAHKVWSTFYGRLGK